MPGAITIGSTTRAELREDRTRRLLVLRNKAAADSGKRVWYAWTSTFTAENAAYLEPGECLVLSAHQFDVGKPMWFLTSSGDASTIYWS